MYRATLISIPVIVNDQSCNAVSVPLLPDPNPGMPGLVKIGLTTRTPKERAAELSSASGVPLPFAVAWARAVTDCATVERVVHRMLDDKRVAGNREVFRVNVQTARLVIEAAAGSALGRRYNPCPAPSKRSGMRRRKRGRV